MPTSLRALASTLLATVLATAGLGFAFAQEAAPSDEERAELEVAGQANLGGDQQVQEAQAVLRRGEDLSRRVQSMLDDARQERDIIRVTCINDKLTQVNANLRTAQQRASQLDDAVAADDTGRRNHEYTVITVLGQKFGVLDREASQCLGEEIYETGATRVTTEIDEDVPDEDPTDTQRTEDLVPIYPPPVSPTL